MIAERAWPVGSWWLLEGSHAKDSQREVAWVLGIPKLRDFPTRSGCHNVSACSGCARTNFQRRKKLSPKGESLASFQALHSPRPIDASVARPSFLILPRAPLPWFLLFLLLFIASESTQKVSFRGTTVRYRIGLVPFYPRLRSTTPVPAPLHRS